MEYAVVVNKNGSIASTQLLPIEKAIRKAADTGKSYVPVGMGEPITPEPSPLRLVKKMLREAGVKCESYKGRFSMVHIPLGIFPKLDVEAVKHATVQDAGRTYLTFDGHGQWSLGQAREDGTYNNGETHQDLVKILDLMR